MQPYKSSPDPAAIETALSRVLGAAEWIARARVAQAEPNGSAAVAAYLAHARQRLLEAVALIDGRPSFVAAITNRRQEHQQ
jgi:hypothetical protein